MSQPSDEERDLEREILNTRVPQDTYPRRQAGGERARIAKVNLIAVGIAAIIGLGLIIGVIVTRHGSGGPQSASAPTGAAGTADTQICMMVGRGYPDWVGVDQNAASPDLLSLAQEWGQAYGAAQMGVDGATAKSAEDAAAVAAWCSDHGLGWAA